MLKNIDYSLYLKANLFLSTAIYLLFLFNLDSVTLVGLPLVVLGALSSAGILYLFLYIMLFVFRFMGRFGLVVTSFIFLITDVALLVDFFVYRLYHFHINGMVLNIITSPDAIDSIQLGIAPVVSFMAVIGSIIFFMWWILKKIRAMGHDEKIALNRKLNRYVILPLVLIFFIEKIGFGFATLYSKREITTPFRVIPLYQGFTFNKFAYKKFGIKPKAESSLGVDSSMKLNYPLSPIRLDKTADRFNIFIIASDAVQADRVDSKTMPNVMKFAKDSVVLQRHYSGGNSTRFGIFSLIYGLNSKYWFSFLNAREKPVLFDVLKKMDYDISVISSTSTNWPEFRKTCYIDIQDKLYDDFKGSPWKKDRQSSKKFISLIKRIIEKPRFSFIFMDAPHGYSYPEKMNKFGAKGGVNYMAVAPNNEATENALKAYKNSLYYDDMLFGEMISGIKQAGLYDNSMIIFTSDHGQEFFEYGMFGHNSSFSKGQIQVPMMIKLPSSMQESLAGKKIQITAHQDIVPTILSLLGVKNEPSDYSNGANIFGDSFNRNHVVSANWNDNAVVTQDKVYLFSDIIGSQSRRLDSYENIEGKKPSGKLILDIIKQNKKFLKK